MPEHDRPEQGGAGPPPRAGKSPQPAAASPPHGYRAYGMAIRSDLPLPELDRDTADVPDLAIRLGATGRPLPQPPSAAVCEYSPESQYVAWPGVGAFLIHGTHTIVIEPAPGVSTPLLNLPLLGPVMALLLHLRGMLVLHASAVDLGGRAVAFLGAQGSRQVDCGRRRSSLRVTACWQMTCWPLISPIPRTPTLSQAFPQLKLAEDAASGLAVEGAIAMPLPIPEFPKQQHRLTGRFSHTPVPPSCIYVLARGRRSATISAAFLARCLRRAAVVLLCLPFPAAEKSV